ncbi:MAG: leucyl/phenylalanyl-tRNA--protein transferase [Bacteroidetes bacterium]|nr:leucyl/phenylalanyl-tRNA--protein transferase [Bacteroidota bacterium]
MSEQPVPDIEELLYAYSNGYFPMAHPEEDNAIYWHRPEWRGIIPLEQFYVPKNLARLYRNGPFEFSMDRDFKGVMKGCADRETTWISKEIITAYTALFKKGFAHSVEVWRDNKLVGGLYGVEIRKAFFGESMFSRESNASKLALVHLVRYMNYKKLELLDTQYLNDHIRQFGAVEIPDEKYIELLEHALRE